LDAAVARTRDGNADAERKRAAEQAAVAARKEAADAKVAGFKAALKLCETKDDGTFPSACISDCERDAAGWTCIALGMNYEAALSFAKARPIYKRSCDAGNEHGCEQLEKMENGEAAKKKAEQDIPKLMAKCEAIVGRLRLNMTAVRAAARARDGERVAELQTSRAAMGTEHILATRDLESAINTATGGSGARAVQLMLAGRKACTP
jgi:hypothetical protein